MSNLDTITEISNKYGSNPDYVIAGGGNTSYKDSKYLYIKASGTSLGTITPEGFVKMQRKALSDMLEKTYPEDDKTRDAEVLNDMMNARAEGETLRPSVETILHNLFPHKFVLHVHPAVVNGITCSKNGKKTAMKLFPDAVYVEITKPGYPLAALCNEKLSSYKKKNGKDAELLFLENHGVFFAADTKSGIDKLVKRVMDTITEKIKKFPCFDDAKDDVSRACEIAPAVRMLYAGDNGKAVVEYVGGKDTLAFDPDSKAPTPDHIVYAKRKWLSVEKDVSLCTLKESYEKFKEENGYCPKVIFVKGVGAFACGKTKKEADTVKAIVIDFVKIAVYAKSFGGYSPMGDEYIDFIANWEAESYRSKVSFSAESDKRLEGKIAIVTGAAQGFGKGIAEQMAKEGAYIVVADMNLDGAVQTASELPYAMAVQTNVTDEDSVKALVEQTVLAYGGLDILVNNAGIVRAGSLEEMTKSNFELVTQVNYTAYFLCVKHAVQPMKIQHEIAPDKFFDVIEINSKSGLIGSNKNFAYAGSKFGGLGLTQSFALELAPYNIKVNAVCPGNFLEGPLWTDPVKGLLVQYLNAGKVPGAKTTEDVLRYYESKVPLNRGCRIIDVVRAILYIIEQEYETGQAVPVTGGQAMLN